MRTDQWLAAALTLIALSVTSIAAVFWHDRAESQPANPFIKIATVLQHPRCLNCHPRGDNPLQGSDNHPHLMKIARGADDKGAVAARCYACHRDENNAATGVPGAPHWQLAPISMGWQGLSVSELCAVLKNPQLNGNRSLADLVKHMDEDKLVQWGWNPGRDIDGKAREPVPIPHTEFVALLKEWAALDGVCP
ncbi:MAG TPA: hypothetical protein VKT73_12730 [Xanthobacteraceae bacterium]|nr:hypothetical protein [Xanthobacteraceae bacterium]